MTKYYYIYKITNNINGKIYVGKRTSRVEPYNDVKYTGSGKIIKRAINKYGIENFSKDILEICTKENLNNRERFYIAKVGCTDITKGYNILPGGDGTDGYCSTLKTYYNSTLDQEIRISEYDEIPEGFVPGRRPFAEDVIKKMARHNKDNGMYGVHRCGDKNPFYGKKHTSETMKRLRNRRWIINPNTGEKKVIMLPDELPTGYVFINEYRKEHPCKPRKLNTSEDKTNYIKKLSDSKKEFWKNKPLETCPYCGKVGRGVGFARWHKENCRLHPIRGASNREKSSELMDEHGKKLRGKKSATQGKICITNGKVNKFVNPEDCSKFEGFHVGMTKTFK